MACSALPVEELAENVAAIERGVARIETLVLRLVETPRPRPKARPRRAMQLALFPDPAPAG